MVEYEAKHLLVRFVWASLTVFLSRTSPASHFVPIHWSNVAIFQAVIIVTMCIIIRIKLIHYKRFISFIVKFDTLRLCGMHKILFIHK